MIFARMYLILFRATVSFTLASAVVYFALWVPISAALTGMGLGLAISLAVLCKFAIYKEFIDNHEREQ